LALAGCERGAQVAQFVLQGFNARFRSTESLALLLEGIDALG
jgi:hypothetical protein